MAKPNVKGQGAAAPSAVQSQPESSQGSQGVNALSTPETQNTQLSVSAAFENLVNVSLDGVRVVRQGTEIPDGNGGMKVAKSTVIGVVNEKGLSGLFPMLNADGRATKRDAIGGELKKLEAALSGAQAADVSWVTRQVRIQKNESEKGKNKGLMKTTVVRQQIRIKDEAEAMVAAHGKTVEFWRKVIALNADAAEPVKAPVAA